MPYPLTQLFTEADEAEQELVFLLTGGLRIRGTVNAEDMRPGYYFKVWPTDGPDGEHTVPVVVKTDHVIAATWASHSHLLPETVEVTP